MTKTSTIQFTINNLASKSRAEFVEKEKLLNFEEEYAEIFEMLEEKSLDVRQEVVDQILQYAANSE